MKVLHHHFAEDQEFVERFRREASSAARLSHPNIVGIFDRGEWNGTYYIAMEYVAGRSLKTIVREQGALDPAAAIDIVVQILRAARFAHRRGVIHRDLKPHNVILDEEGRARVTDFGIARAGASDMTLTGLDHGHRPVPLARAGPGPAGERRLRPVLGGRDPVRAADRRGPVRWRDRRGDRVQAGLAPSRVAAQRAEPGPARARSTRSCCARSRRTPRSATPTPTSSSRRSQHERRRPAGAAGAVAAPARVRRRVAGARGDRARPLACRCSPPARLARSRPTAGGLWAAPWLWALLAWRRS